MPPLPSDVTPPTDKVAALVEEFLEERRAEQRPARRRVSPTAWRHALTACLALVCAATWLVPLPATTPPRPDPLVARAGDDLALFLAAQRVDEFRTRQGRLPATLVEAGVSDTVMQLTARSDGSYQLARVDGRRELRFDSRDSTRSNLRAAIAVLEGTGR